MRRSQWFATSGLLLVAALAVAGCGGSSGGDDDGGSQPLRINANNAQLVGGSTLGAVSTLGDVAGFGVQLASLLGNLPAAPRQAARSAAILVDGVCVPGQGTVDVTVDDVAPAGELSAGDSAVVTFTSCVMDDSTNPTTFTGVIAVSVSDVVTGAFPLPPYDVTFAFNLANLSVTDDVGTTVVGGDFDLNLQSDDGVTLASTLSGASLSLSESGFSASLSNFMFVGTSNQLTDVVQGSGRLTSSEFGGDYVQFETTEDFVRTDPDFYPHVGTLVATGAANSSLTATAVSATTVELALDANGDGTTDSGYPVEVSWDDFDL